MTANVYIDLKNGNMREKVARFLQSKGISALKREVVSILPDLKDGDIIVTDVIGDNTQWDIRAAHNVNAEFVAVLGKDDPREIENADTTVHANEDKQVDAIFQEVRTLLQNHVRRK